jgi:hypothetical protein
MIRTCVHVLSAACLFGATAFADDPFAPIVQPPVTQIALLPEEDALLRAAALEIAQREAQVALDPSLALDQPGGLNFSGGITSFRPPEAAGGLLQPSELTIRSTNLAGIGTGQIPEDTAAKEMTAVRDLPEGPDRDGQWYLDTLNWQASCVFHHPLYFEDIVLERYGQQRFPWLQPWISGARFYATLPALPYLMTVEPMGDLNYTLGSYRPGSCNPVLKQRPPYQRDAAVVEGLWVSGAIIAFP